MELVGWRISIFCALVEVAPINLSGRFVRFLISMLTAVALTDALVAKHQGCTISKPFCLCEWASAPLQWRGDRARSARMSKARMTVATEALAPSCLSF
jgi:hypothetical protein